MTVGMELRDRIEGNTSFNQTQNGDRIYDLTRLWGNVEVRPTHFLTGYIQFMDTHALGLPAHAVAGNMRDNFDDRQAYLNLHVKPGGIPITAIAGRQELKFGSERVIGISDWTNNSRTFDAFDLRLGDKNRVDLFSSSVVAIHPYSLDKHGDGLQFHGVYGQITTWIPAVNFQPYVLVHTAHNISDQQGRLGNQVETDFGFEANGKLPAHFDYIVNASLERGSYGEDSIHAGQSFGKVSYSMDSLPWKPRLGGEYDYATGNTGRNPFRHSTYDQQYPSNHNAFGLFDLFGYQNIRQERLNLDLGPTPNLTFLVQGEFLNVVNEHDNVYASGGTAYIRPPAGGFHSDQIGAGIDFSGKYVWHNYLVGNIGVGHFFPGDIPLQNGHAPAQTYAYLSVTYRFRVDKHAVRPQTRIPDKANAASSH
jgi:hypothetical protein